MCVSSYEIESNRALCRSSCARTCAGAVPPRVLRACRLPRRLKHSYTSLPIWGLNSCSTDRGSSDRSTWWLEQPVKPRVGYLGRLCACQRPPSGNLAAHCSAEKEVTEANKKALEAQIVRLRKKLQQAGAQEPTIKAIRGQGYRLCVKVGLSA